MTTTIEDLQEDLAGVRAAIARAEAVQKYGTADKSKENADLADLYAERARLRKEIASLERSTGQMLISHGSWRRPS